MVLVSLEIGGKVGRVVCQGQGGTFQVGRAQQSACGHRRARYIGSPPRLFSEALQPLGHAVDSSSDWRGRGEEGEYTVGRCEMNTLGKQSLSSHPKHVKFTYPRKGHSQSFSPNISLSPNPSERFP